MSMVDEGGNGNQGTAVAPGSARTPTGPNARDRRLQEILRVPQPQVDEPGAGPESTAEPPPARRPRADARDNRQRLLAAADSVFGVQGVGASLDLIAQEAGVGRATLYRHFPSREALLAALHDGMLTSIENHARHLGERADGLFELLAFYVDQVARRATLIDYWVSLTPDVAMLLRGRTRLLVVIEPLLERAIQHRRCRPGITAIDMLVVINMLTIRPTGRTGEERRVLGRRALELLLVGLHP